MKKIKFRKKKIEEFKKKFIFLKKFKFKSTNISNLLLLRSLQYYSEYQDLTFLKKKTYQFFQEFKPKKIFLNMTRGINSFYIDYANKSKIPCYLISHGTISWQKNKFSRMYNKNISQELVSKNGINCAQTKIALEFFKKNNIKNNFKTGNIVFSNSNTKKKEKIIYAVTSRDFNHMYPYGIETFYEFYNNLTFLNFAALELKPLKIFVKLHPIISHLSNELTLLFKNLYFSNKNLKKLFKSSVATISFSSTSIEDSLCSNIPVILLDRWKRYEHCKSEKNLSIKNKAVYYANTKDNLIKCINTIVESKNVRFNEYTFLGSVENNINKIF